MGAVKWAYWASNGHFKATGGGGGGGVRGRNICFLISFVSQGEEHNEKYRIKKSFLTKVMNFFKSDSQYNYNYTIT